MGVCVAIPSRVTSVDELDEAAFASAGRILLVKKGELVFLEDVEDLGPGNLLLKIRMMPPEPLRASSFPGAV